MLLKLEEKMVVAGRGAGGGDGGVGGGSLCSGSCSGSHCVLQSFSSVKLFWRTLIIHFSGASKMELSIIDSAEQKRVRTSRGRLASAVIVLLGI